MRTLLKATVVFIVFISLVYFTLSLQSCERDRNGLGCESNSIDDTASKYVEQKNSQESHLNEQKAPQEDANKLMTRDPRWSLAIHLAVVACGDRLEETIVMIKSAVLLTETPIHVHIFADDELRPIFHEKLEGWPTNVRRRLTHTVYPIQFPSNQNAEQWKKLFKLCASQRLFIPDILRDLEVLLYVDTDVLFLRPLDDIWQFFAEFNSTQIAALAPEHEEPSASWYARFARHPYVPLYGVNSGVMLMNLTRMRNVNWTNHVTEYYQKHRFDITWGDQDLINIFFHYFPDMLYQYPCKWNYRPDHCMYMSNCRSAELDGVSVLHGCRSTFHTDKQPVFKAIYQAVRDHQFESDLGELLGSIATNIKSAERSQCGTVAHIFTKQLSHSVKLR